MIGIALIVFGEPSQRVAQELIAQCQIMRDDFLEEAKKSLRANELVDYNVFSGLAQQAQEEMNRICKTLVGDANL